LGIEGSATQAGCLLALAATPWIATRSRFGVSRLAGGAPRRRALTVERGVVDWMRQAVLMQPLAETRDTPTLVNDITDPHRMPALSAAVLCMVVGISDGDTIKVRCGEAAEEKVRLLQIDAPEKKQAFGTKAKEALSPTWCTASRFSWSAHRRIATGARSGA
jgi:hypothetical protein